MLSLGSCFVPTTVRFPRVSRDIFFYPFPDHKTHTHTRPSPPISLCPRKQEVVLDDSTSSSGRTDRHHGGRHRSEGTGASYSNAGPPVTATADAIAGEDEETIDGSSRRDHNSGGGGGGSSKRGSRIGRRLRRGSGGGSGGGGGEHGGSRSSSSGPSGRRGRVSGSGEAGEGPSRAVAKRGVCVGSAV